MRILLRHDTLDEWEKVNPVLMDAEIVEVKEQDYNSIVIGDGEHKFNELPRVKLQDGLTIEVSHLGGRRIVCNVVEDVVRERDKNMNENYIVINGKKAELTEEQLKALGIKKERKNPFEKVDDGKFYSYIDAYNNVDTYKQCGDEDDDMLFKTTNYFNDKEFANQIALHQLLYRKLLKFAYDNGYEDTQEWNKTNVHWCILYNYNTNEFTVDCFGTYKYDGVWFSSDLGAKRAIKEIVEPFVKEHPEFVW